MKEDLLMAIWEAVSGNQQAARLAVWKRISAGVMVELLACVLA
jgi:hypothetical protein